MSTPNDPDTDPKPDRGPDRDRASELGNDDGRAIDAGDDRRHDAAADHDVAAAEYEPWMRLALAEAEAAVEHGDVPVGAVVVRGAEVIARRHNERELTGDPVAHAEILALRDAADTVGSWRLDDCTLVVTLEPCAMCAGAAVNARLGTIVFGASDPKAGAVISHFRLVDGAPLNHRVEVHHGVLPDECGEVLRRFFRARR